jgi:hypothetical protein
MNTKSIRDFVAAPIKDLESAKAWINGLVMHDMDFHLEDDPDEIIRFSTGEALFTPDEVPVVRKRVAALYAQDWTNDEGCPIGYMMKVMK